MQFSRFIAVGMLNTVIGYVVYWIGLKLGFIYALAAIISQVVGSINSYFCNKYFTFNKKGKSKMEILGFALVSVIQYVFNILFIAIFVTVFYFSDEIAGLLSIVCCTAISFLGHKFISFRK